MKLNIIGVASGVIVTCIVLLSTCGLKTGEEPTTESKEGQLFMFTSPPVPDSLTFMGENVPLGRFDVFESLDRELLVNSYFHSQTIRLIKLAPRYFPVIDPILKEEGIPSDFRYLAAAESTLDPRATSPAGAAGLWQFMKPAAVRYGLEVNAEVDERFHVEKSTRAACRYLKEMYAKYRNWGLAAASYNAGPAAVDKQIERQKESNYFDLLLNEETARYVFRIISLKLVLENPEKYGFLVKETEKYPVLKTRKIELTGPIPDLATYAKGLGMSYKMLKYYNPWLRDNFLTNREAKIYILQIPD
jgi:hypothetical protein